MRSPSSSLECVSSGTIHSNLRIVPLETHSNNRNGAGLRIVPLETHSKEDGGNEKAGLLP